MKRAWLSLLFLILKLAFAAILVGVAYYAPGQSDTQVKFVDYIVDIKTGALAAGAVAAILLTVYILRFFAWVKKLPAKLKQQLAERRIQRAKDCLLESYTAMSSGELDTALSQATKAKSLDNTGIFHDIFEAQTLFMTGDLDRAEIKFGALRSKAGSRFLGIRGLISVRKKQNRTEDLRILLIEALKDRPNSTWALQELLDFNLKALEFDKAKTVIEQLRITGALTKGQSNRYFAITAYLQALQSKQSGDNPNCESHLSQALKFDKSLTAASIELAKLYITMNARSKALKTLERGYESNPDFAYIPILSKFLQDESPVDQYRLTEEIVSSHPDHRCTHIILTRLAIQAKLWGQAKLHLSIIKDSPTQLTHELLADLEKSEHPNHSNEVEKHLHNAAHAAPEGIWLCQNCHTQHISWSVFCPSCQGFDKITWDNSAKQSPIALLEG